MKLSSKMLPMLDFMLGPSYASVVVDYTEEANPIENVTK